MVEIADIKDRDGLEDWLQEQPREVSVWIASRAAARALPVWWRAVLTEDWARDPGLAALPVLRGLLITSVAAFAPTADVRSAAGRAAKCSREAAEAAYDPESQVARAVEKVADAVADGRTAWDKVVFFADGRARVATDDSVNAICSATLADANSLDEGRVPTACKLWHDLWPDKNGPSYYSGRHWPTVKTKVAEASDEHDWQFWLDWYEALLAGRTLLSDPARTRDMLEQIALIDPATWDAGPEVVNPLIREIRELYRLRLEVAALQAQKDAFLAVRASEAQRRHNQPPDGLVDDQPDVAREITIVWDSLDEARDELEQETPDKGRLHAIAERLGAALKAIVQYCGKVTDTVVMSAAKVGGGAVGTAVLDHVVNNGRLMEFAKDLLSYASGG